MSRESVEKLVSCLEMRLIENPHYAYCRRLGQLGPVRVAFLKSGVSECYLERCAALGQRRGSIKPTALHPKSGWSAWFGVPGSETIHGVAG
jgi:hypothetical protein